MPEQAQSPAEAPAAEGAGPRPSDAGGDEGLLDRLRGRMGGTGVGVEDPDIVGDAGPTDVAPGRDPDAPDLARE